MPDDRLFHKTLGHSDKVNSLTDFEDLTWRSYVLAADDFGIMRFSAITLRAENDRMARKSQKVVQRALEAVAATGLIRTFEHQNRIYCYQHDWQDWQKVTYPKRTVHPMLPAEALMSCTDNTRWLFTAFPGGKKIERWQCPESFWKNSGISPEKFPIPESLARVPALTLTKTNGNGSDERQTESRKTVMSGSLPKNHLAHVWCGRVCVPEFLHNQFAQAIGKDDEVLYAFYRETFAAIPDDEPVEPDAVKFWRPRVSAKWPPKRVEKSDASLQEIYDEMQRQKAARS